MISEIKVFKPDGKLKEVISKEKALRIYDEQNKTNWSLSPAEKKWWKGFTKEDLVKENQTGNGRGGIGLRYKTYKKREAIYKTICVICGGVTMKTSKEAKYCGKVCAGKNRRRNANLLYQKKKREGTLHD